MSHQTKDTNQSSGAKQSPRTGGANKMTQDKLAKFAKVNDYAVIFNAGWEAVNDPEAKQEIAQMILLDYTTITELSDEEVEMECPEMQPEVDNGCTIYKVANEDAPHFDNFYIAYYE